MSRYARENPDQPISHDWFATTRQTTKATLSPKPCISCGSKLVDPEGIIFPDGSFGPQCFNCGAAALSLDAWNNRDHLKDLLTNAIDQAIRKANCSSYDDWSSLISNLLDNPQDN